MISFVTEMAITIYADTMGLVLAFYTENFTGRAVDMKFELKSLIFITYFVYEKGFLYEKDYFA